MVSLKEETAKYINYYNMISSDDFIDEVANEMLEAEPDFLSSLTATTTKDAHYKALAYQPRDFINKFNLNFNAGNFLKLISRFKTTNRKDLTRESQLEGISYFLRESIRNIDKTFFEPCGLIMELKRYVLANKFNENQAMYLNLYFEAVINRDSLQLKVMLDNLSKFL